MVPTINFIADINKKVVPCILFNVWLILVSVIPVNLFAQSSGKAVEQIPYEIMVYNNPVEYLIEKNRVEISAAGKTNLFNNPNGQSRMGNAPMLLFEPIGDFTLSAKVTGKLKAIYDVAALVVYQDENSWAKLCFENSVKKQPTIVSVVTRTYSDDCNSMTTGEFAFLSVIKKGSQYSFFYSSDGVEWEMIRSFHLEAQGRLRVGFAAHGSRGEGFTGIFTDINFKESAIEDMRTL